MKVVLIDPSNFTIPYDNLLGNGLAENGCDVSIIKRANRPNEAHVSPRITEVEAYYRCVESHRMQLTNMRLFSAAKLLEHIWNSRTLKGVLSDIRPDVLHFQWLVVPWLDRRLLRRVLRKYSAVVTVHDTKLYHGVGNTGLQAAGWLDSLNDFAHVIVHTEMSRRVVESAGIDMERVSVIPHGIIPMKPPSSSHVDSSGFRGGATRRLRFLMFGFLKSYKGLDTLAMALDRLPDNVLNHIEVILAGKPHEEVAETLTHFQSDRLKSVVTLDLRFLSEQELSEYLSASDVVLFPYHRIDASGAFMATVPFKKIIIASCVGVFGETISDGRTGILVGPRDSEALAKAIRRVVEDDTFRRELESGAAEFSESIPSWTEIGALTRGVYEKAMTQKASDSGAIEQ